MRSKSCGKTIKSSNYYGIANTEYKYDKRDNLYKIINPRRVYEYSALKSGVNLFRLLLMTDMRT